MRDRIEALEAVIGRLRRLERLRAARLLPPPARGGARLAARPSSSPAGGSAPARDLPPGEGALLEVEAGLAEARTAEREPSLDPWHAEELLALAPFLRRPPPELRICALDRDAIAAALGPARRLAA